VPRVEVRVNVPQCVELLDGVRHTRLGEVNQKSVLKLQ
jgi:hypothetical protein